MRRHIGTFRLQILKISVGFFTRDICTSASGWRHEFFTGHRGRSENVFEVGRSRYMAQRKNKLTADNTGVHLVALPITRFQAKKNIHFHLTLEIGMYRPTLLDSKSLLVSA